MIVDVQWYSGHAGGGVRSAMLYGVTRVHRREERETRTLCGRELPWQPRQMLRPDVDDRRCKVCVSREAAGA